MPTLQCLHNRLKSTGQSVGNLSKSHKIIKIYWLNWVFLKNGKVNLTPCTPLMEALVKDSIKMWQQSGYLKSENIDLPKTIYLIVLPQIFFTQNFRISFIFMNIVW